MSGYAVVWELDATNKVAGYLGDATTPETRRSLAEVYVRVDELAENPCPPDSHSWGPDHRRLHHGMWRILYRVDKAARTIYVEHVGRRR
ncbi:type II toxin-antitoxin system RelE/ParE family toxin [Streptomyces sp. WMMC500]|uniref:type II toxin-antitoxin system RelE family toxin n=1 Tax=Streptomyces sp. WMMC500 TaxID=3015154 RepID=UPI00248D38C2|nr:type II toxin-antitoxin system RelE/ParE family toxin [Streptomyces sp. WMMC500]WBB63892.1 type II toxin-antitoxin system RelE/ParE family toxin [Streptomyces sp. WMMC500]